MLKPNQLNKIVKNKKRIGRGEGSGLGKTSGRGSKGQKSRSGSKISPGFEGGQNPLKKRIPKFGGFNRDWSGKPQIINIGRLGDHFKTNQIVSPESLLKKGLIKDANIPIKILGDGVLEKKLRFKGCLFSKKVENELGRQMKKAKKR